MTLQAADPRSLLEPKPGWSERTGPWSFRLVLSHEELRLARARELAPRMGAFREILEGLLARER